jgi:hypothetical protein
LLVEGGLALPSIGNGHLGSAIPKAFYNLEENLYEDDALSANVDLAGS